MYQFRLNCKWSTTCVSAFHEILQSLLCKISQYTFLTQYPTKFQDFFSLCKIQQPDHIGIASLSKMDHRRSLLQFHNTNRKRLEREIQKILKQILLKINLGKSVFQYWKMDSINRLHQLLSAGDADQMAVAQATSMVKEAIYLLKVKLLLLNFYFCLIQRVS